MLLKEVSIQTSLLDSFFNYKLLFKVIFFSVFQKKLRLSIL